MRVQFTFLSYGTSYILSTQNLDIIEVNVICSKVGKLNSKAFKKEDEESSKTYQKKNQFPESISRTNFPLKKYVWSFFRTCLPLLLKI